MNPTELNEVIRLHGMWLRGEAGGIRANLSGANLSRAIGVLRLPVSDPRGYEYIAVWHGFDWRIYAACRNFNEAEARAHWLSDRYPGPASVKETMGCGPRGEA